jgi:hypothetical protein
MLVNFVYAGSNGYQCVIATEAQLQTSGHLAKPMQKSALGKRFSIDRRTGTLIEPDGEHWTFGGNDSSVIANGNKDNSFMALNVSPAAGGGSHATFVIVNEYENVIKKPFILVTGALVYTGTCE